MKALILIDIQNDFLSGGPLAVPDGDAVIPIANAVQPAFDLTVATQDWHPPNHGSFAENHDNREVGETIQLNGLDQVLWPTHCVQGTQGAEFAEELNRDHWWQIFRKGTNSMIDSYSGFFDNGHRKTTGLGGYLNETGASSGNVMGLATDDCVKYTAVSARELYGSLRGQVLEARVDDYPANRMMAGVARVKARALLELADDYC